VSTVPTPRIRVFAGPNGSEKSTLLNRLSASNIPLYSVVNPDEIEKRLNSEEGLRLLDYGLTSTKSDFLAACRTLINRRQLQDIPSKLMTPRIDESYRLLIRERKGGKGAVSGVLVCYALA